MDDDLFPFHYSKAAPELKVGACLPMPLVIQRTKEGEQGLRTGQSWPRAGSQVGITEKDSAVVLHRLRASESSVRMGDRQAQDAADSAEDWTFR